MHVSTHVSYNTMVTEWENFQNWAIQLVNSQETFAWPGITELPNGEWIDALHYHFVISQQTHPVKVIFVIKLLEDSWKGFCVIPRITENVHQILMLKLDRFFIGFINLQNFLCASTFWYTTWVAFKLEVISSWRSSTNRQKYVSESWWILAITTFSQICSLLHESRQNWKMKKVTCIFRIWNGIGKMVGSGNKITCYLLCI